MNYICTIPFRLKRKLEANCKVRMMVAVSRIRDVLELTHLCEFRACEMQDEWKIAKGKPHIRTTSGHCSAHVVYAISSIHFLHVTRFSVAVVNGGWLSFEWHVAISTTSHQAQQPPYTQLLLSNSKEKLYFSKAKILAKGAICRQRLIKIWG